MKSMTMDEAIFWELWRRKKIQLTKSDIYEIEKSGHFYVSPYKKAKEGEVTIEEIEAIEEEIRKRENKE